MKKHLTVCYFGTYRAEYSRNQIMIKGLRRNQVEVIECHEQLWQNIDERVAAIQGEWKNLKFWLHVLRTYFRLLRKYWAMNKDYDLLVVGYPGQFDVYLARVLSWWQRKPLVWDVFMSIYLIAIERGLEQQHHVIINMIRYIESIACRLPDRLILDTVEYVGWFNKTHAILPERFRLVPTGADDDRFCPWLNLCNADGSGTDFYSGQSQFVVLYYGSFIPNHGVLQIIEAAKLLVDQPDILFLMIGKGPEQAKATELVKEYQLQNVRFLPWMEQPELAAEIARADICLGAFGLTPQSLMTVQNKIYEGLASAKAVITGDSPALRAVFQDREHLFLTNRQDPRSLARAILTLKADVALRRDLAEKGYQWYKKNFTIEQLGRVYREHLEDVVCRA